MENILMQRPVLWQRPKTSAKVLLCQTELVNRLTKRLTSINERFNAVKFASSLAVEDMLITDMLVKLGFKIEIFTLNTGKLHQQTLALINQLQSHYRLTISCYYPDQQQAQHFEQKYGKAAMYDSLDLRHQCCLIRKIEPLNQALLNADAWLTGQRQEQSQTRQFLQFEQLDQQRQISKFNPIYDWSEQDVWAYVEQNQVPVNQLYQQGYPSIGCEPCTKAVRQGEDIRAGRWWWESKENKECGLHINR